MKEKQIYLDSHASTPVDRDVLTAMLPYFTEFYGNGNHKAGWKTIEALENARFQVSNVIGAKPNEIIFTSGATEAINMALLGLASANTSKRNHIVTQKTEHKAVLKTIGELIEKGYRVTMLEVDAVGRIELNELAEVVTDQTLVVAIMLVNNEIGTIQPVKEIGKIAKSKGAKFFCDITQGLGWHKIDVQSLNIDLASMSSHKIYGPRGIGALFIKKTNPKTHIKPIQFGGGHERNLRPGTHNIPAIVGFGKACEIIQSNELENHNKLMKLRDSLQYRLFDAIEGIQLNGCPSLRHPGNLNISIPNISGEQLKELLPNIIFSTSSACSSQSIEPSHVLSSITKDENRINNTFRIGIGKLTTEKDIEIVLQKIIEKVYQLQQFAN